MGNTRNSRKKPSGPSAVAKPKPPPPLTAAARKAASKKKGNQASNNENCQQDPSDNSNAGTRDMDNPGEPLADGQNTPHRNDVGTQELMEKYTKMQGE
jgi:hypothetical protein